MANRVFFETVSMVYHDISVYRDRMKRGLPVREDMVIQSDEDAVFARKLAQYLQDGGYLPKGKIADNARTILLVFRGAETGQSMSDKTDLTLRQVYSAMDLVEERLESTFPTGLKNLWKTRQFDVIEQFIRINPLKVNDVLHFLNENAETLNYADKLYGFRGSVSMAEVKKQAPLLDKEFADSCVRAYEVLDSARALVQSAQLDIYNLFVLIRLLESNSAIPFEVYSELVLNDRFNLFSSEDEVDFLEEVR